MLRLDALTLARFSVWMVVGELEFSAVVILFWYMYSTCNMHKRGPIRVTNFRPRALLQVRDMGELRGGLEVSFWGANLTVIKRVLFDRRHGFLDYLE